MTSVQHLADALYLFLSVALLYIVWFQWRTYRIDAIRQRLLVLRDDIFDYACNGGVPFNNESYVLLRQKINAMIRFAHQISFARLMTSIVVFRFLEKPKSSGKHHQEWLASLKSLDTLTKNKFAEIDARISVLLVQHMVLGSPILCVLFGVFVPIAAVAVAAMHCWELLAKRMPGLDLIEAQALKA